MNIAINANRAKSGGGIRHLKGILNNLPDYVKNKHKIHLWSHEQLLNQIDPNDCLIKHKYKLSNKNILHQLLWEKFKLIDEIRNNNCDVLINIDAGSLCTFKKSITMSRDMLPFEPNIIKDFPFKYKFRQILLRYISINSLNKAGKVIFLTNYAYQNIRKYLKRNIDFEIVPHGVDQTSFNKNSIISREKTLEKTITYISPFLPYKHQDNVIYAFNLLKSKGYKIKLKLIGNMTDYSKDSIKKAFNKIDLKDSIQILENISQNQIPKYLNKTDIFIFASSCENMPNTLLEAMASGLPIACSNMGPMPEILKDAGVYFNPHDYSSIYKSLKKLLDNESLMKELSQKAKNISKKYTWLESSESLFKAALSLLN